ncbi:MAG: cobalt-precorrin 5A hydrolase [Lachnospiraceae bacterium]|nr:cobalt-precorrin 5A hydrolase [Lachnospiraceae bacterium]
MGLRLAVISFTKAGCGICRKLVKGFTEQGEDCRGYVQKKFLNEVQEEPGICAVEQSVGEWTAERFAALDGLIYIGAAGIAVRAIAPCLKDKLTDPAVVVLDEQGNYAVSLLSGHVGGANLLARRAAQITGAVPVITTASDVQGKTAPDVWAKERGLVLSDRRLAAEVAAALVNGEVVGFYSDYPLTELVPADYARGQLCAHNVWLTVRVCPEPDSTMSMFLPEQAAILRMIPKTLTVGIGCRRGTERAVLECAVREAFVKHNLDLRGIEQAASIDLKREEAGLLALVQDWQLPFLTYSAEELSEEAGSQAESEFVRSVTGVGNVCERAALLGAGPGGKLLAGKEIYQGVTVAVAEKPWKIGAKKDDRG